MKEKDLILIKQFRSNSRQSLTKLSKMTKIPISTIYDKLKSYEKNIIIKHTALVNFRLLGFEIKVRLLLSALKTAELKKYLLNHDQINSIFRVNNGFEYEVEALFKNMKEFQTFLEEIKQFNITAIKEYFILDDIKREGFLTAGIV